MHERDVYTVNGLYCVSVKLKNLNVTLQGFESFTILKCIEQCLLSVSACLKSFLSCILKSDSQQNNWQFRHLVCFCVFLDVASVLLMLWFPVTDVCNLSSNPSSLLWLPSAGIEPWHPGTALRASAYPNGPQSRSY